METRTYFGNPDRHDQSVAQGARFSICQRAVGEHSLPGYGPVVSVKRPVRTRMRGVVGLGEKNPRLPDWGEFSRNTFINVLIKFSLLVS